MGVAWSGPAALLLGGVLLLSGLLWHRGRVCRLGGGCLMVLGVLFCCTPCPWAGPVVAVFAAATLAGVLLESLLG